MKKIEKVLAGTHFSAITVGRLNELGGHTLVLAPGVSIPGKVFMGDSLLATGAEMSFQLFEPGAGVSFLHTHKTHEGFIFLSKEAGEFQVDGKIFGIDEGSVVRVSPEGKRSVRNTGGEPLVMICVQYKANSFDDTDRQDGEILSDRLVW